MNTNQKTIEKFITLNDGNQIPCIGFGSWEITNLPEVLFEAIKNGLRLIDTASIYGNEKEVGEAITRALKEKIVERKDLFVVTKLIRIRKDKPEEEIIKQLKDLNLDYVDLYLDHWPLSISPTQNGEIRVPQHVVWKNLESLVKKGYTKSIGLSNYNVQSVMNILSFCEIKPVVNQIECNPYYWNSNLIKYCFDNQIQVMAYSPLCKAQYIKRFHGESLKLDLFEEPIIVDIAKKYSKTKAQILINWGLSQGLISIPSSGKPERIKENSDSSNFRLEEEDIKKIGSLHTGFKCCNPINLFGRIDIFA